MEKYSMFFGEAPWNAEHTFDSSAFGDIEFMETANEIKDSRLDPLLHITVGGTIICNPMIADNVLYFGACDKIMYALSLDGKPAWKFATGGPILSSPCLAGNLIVFGSFDTNVYAVDKNTGELAWRFGTGGKVFSTPFFDGQRIYVGSADHNMYCLSLEGELIWKVMTGGPIETHPSVHNNIMFFGSNDQNLYAVRPSDGTVLWKFGVSSHIRLGFVFWKNTVYFGCMEDIVHGIDMHGKEVFRFRMNDTCSGMLLVDDGVLYIPSRDNYMYAVRADTGDLLWKLHTGHAVEGGAVSNGRIYFGSCDQNIYCADAKTGRLFWKHQTNGMVNCRPVVHNGVAYVGCWDCNMRAVEAETGNLIWKFATSISQQSDVDMGELRPQKQIEIVWKADDEEEKERHEARVDLHDYGTITSDYTSGVGKDYIKGKKGYI